jgi:hypothetical protein
MFHVSDEFQQKAEFLLSRVQEGTLTFDEGQDQSADLFGGLATSVTPVEHLRILAPHLQLLKEA